MTAADRYFFQTKEKSGRERGEAERAGRERGERVGGERESGKGEKGEKEVEGKRG